jgi:membrane-associated phospholipid phosphatase
MEDSGSISRDFEDGDEDVMMTEHFEIDLDSGSFETGLSINRSSSSDAVLSLTSTAPSTHSQSAQQQSSSRSRASDRTQQRRKFWSERFPDRRVIFLLAVMQAMGAVFLVLAGVVESVVITVVWGLLSLGLYVFIRWANHRGYNDTLSAAVARGLLMGALALSILFYYEGTHGTVHEMREREPDLKLYDDELLAMDRAMLGWVFPDGQLSLWADENRFIGPTSLIGPLLTEILQIYYASFFGWCSVLIVYVGLWEYFICGFVGARTDSLEADVESHNPHKYTEMQDMSAMEDSDEKDRSSTAPSFSGASNKKGLAKTYRYRFLKWTFWFTHDAAVWRRLLMIILAILGAFLLNYLVSFMIPAVSPRVSLADRFKHPLSGYWFSDIIRGTLSKTDEGTYGSFPSGHVALTWVPAIVALKLGYPKYGWSCLVAAVLITFSTLYLRYHYFTDVLFAIPLIVFGLYFGGIYTMTPYKRAARRVWRWVRPRLPLARVQVYGDDDGLRDDDLVLGDKYDDDYDDYDDYDYDDGGYVDGEAAQQADVDESSPRGVV